MTRLNSDECAYATGRFGLGLISTLICAHPRELEKASYALFLRLRRFGRSLFRTILQSQYDIDYAHLAESHDKSRQVRNRGDRPQSRNFDILSHQ